MKIYTDTGFALIWSGHREVFVYSRLTIEYNVFISLNSKRGCLVNSHQKWIAHQNWAVGKCLLAITYQPNLYCFVTGDWSDHFRLKSVELQNAVRARVFKEEESSFREMAIYPFGEHTSVRSKEPRVWEDLGTAGRGKSEDMCKIENWQEFPALSPLSPAIISHLVFSRVMHILYMYTNHILRTRKVHWNQFTLWMGTKMPRARF